MSNLWLGAQLEVSESHPRYARKRVQNSQTSITDLSRIEIAPADRLFPMPSATNPNPYIHSTHFEQQVYFGNKNAFSPLTRHICDPKLESAVGSLLSKHTIPRKPVGSPPRTRSCSTDTILHKHSIIGKIQNQAPTSQHQKSLSAIKKEGLEERNLPVGDSPPAVTENLPNLSPFTRQFSFLGNIISPTEPGGKDTREVTAISYPSVTMNQDQIHQTLSQKLLDGSPKSRVVSLNEFPPVCMIKPAVSISVQIRAQSLLAMCSCLLLLLCYSQD